MHRTSLLTAAAAFVLAAGAASAQSTSATTPAAPASPTTPATPAAAAAGPQVTASGDIIQTAKAAGQFNTFLKAVEATNLTQVLKTNKGLTVFAPTDAAFAALPPGELDRLMQPANRAQLQKILTYHVINAPVDSTKIKGAKGPVPTVAGTNVELDGSGEALKVNDATIVQADVRPTNGTLHVIDKVLLPPGTASASAATTSAAGASASAAARPAAPAQGATAGSATRSGPVATTGGSSDAGAQAESRTPGSAAGAEDEGEDQ